MREQILHLVKQYPTTFEKNVLGVGRRERHSQKLHLGLLRRARSFDVIAATAGGDDIGPEVAPALAEGAHVIARQITRRKTLAAIEAQVSIAPKQGLIVERRQIIVAQVARIAALAFGGDDGIDLQNGAPPAERIGAAKQPENGRTAGIGHLLLVIESCGLAVVDPLKRHARHVRAQHGLVQRHPLGGARIDAKIIEFDACHRGHGKY